jgi:hypothetical protein
MPDCFLTFAERSDSQRRATLRHKPSYSPKENPLFPAQPGKRRVLLSIKILFSCEDFSENSFACCAREAAGGASTSPPGLAQTREARRGVACDARLSGAGSLSTLFSLG